MINYLWRQGGEAGAAIETGWAGFAGEGKRGGYVGFEKIYWCVHTVWTN